MTPRQYAEGYRYVSRHGVGDKRQDWWMSKLVAITQSQWEGRLIQPKEINYYYDALDEEVSVEDLMARMKLK